MHRGMLPRPGVAHRLAHRLALALAAGAVVAVPVAPAVAQAQEPAPTTVVGELVQAWPEARHDDEAGHPAATEPLTWVETPDGGAVRVRADEVTGVPVGSTVELTVGDQVVDPADGSGLEPALDVLDTRVVSEPAPVAPPARALTNEVTVVLVTPAGAPRDAVRPGRVAAAVDGPVAAFWREQTRGAVTLGVVGAHDWVATPAGCDEPAAMWDQAAAAVGFESGPGRHLLVYVSSAAAENCTFGLAEVGWQPPSGGRVYVRDLLPSLLAHELGHNFGLGHSSAMHCADGVDAGGCTTAPYRDHYDVMGGSWAQVGSLNVVQAARLGLLTPDAVRTLPADGATTDLTLAPVSGASGVRAVRVVAPGGAQYWLELRTAAGQDRWLTGGANRFGLQAGVLVRRAGTWPDTSLLLDPTPTAGRSGDFETVLPAGRPLALAGGALTVTVGDIGPAGVPVTVRTTAAAGAAPTEPTAPAPDVLAAEGSPTQAAAGADAPAAVPAAQVPAPRAAAQEQADPATVAAVAAPAPPAQDVTAPAVQPASSSRSPLVPAVAGLVLGSAAFVVARRLARSRVRA